MFPETQKNVNAAEINSQANIVNFMLEKVQNEKEKGKDTTNFSTIETCSVFPRER